MRRIMALISVFCASLTAAGAERPFEVRKYRGEYTVNYIPQGWKLADHDGGASGSTLRYVPPGETNENWNEKVTIRVFQGLRMSPQEALEKRINWNFEAHCEGYSRSKIEQEVQNNYATATTVERCGKHDVTGRGDITVFKAIAGRDGFVIVHRTLLIAPFAGSEPAVSKSKWSELMSWLQGVGMCDTRDLSRPCPPDKY